MKSSWEEACLSNRRKFAITLIFIEILMVILYGIFVRIDVMDAATMGTNNTYYPMYQDVNVMMLIGFGFLMTFIRTNSWSALAYTFFINAVVVQLYILLQPFWHHLFGGIAWDNAHRIVIKEANLTSASYSVASILIAFGALLGKVGPLEMLIVALCGIVGYTLNQVLVYEHLKVFDAGGSTAIHTFGAFYGLIVSMILGRKALCKKEPQVDANSNTFAMLGTVFLWMYWPSFNAGYFPTTSVEKSLIIGNTVLSLTGSCLGCFIITSFAHKKFNMEDILNASLAGGVIIGAPSGLITNPFASLLIGCLGGVLSALMFSKLTSVLFRVGGIHDTCGVNNLHGIPGFLGGLLSAIIIASYRAPGINERFQNSLPWSQKVNTYNRTYVAQAGAQVAGTFLSAGIAIMTGILAGIILLCVYEHRNDQNFFEDRDHFEVEDHDQQRMRRHQILNNTTLNNTKNDTLNM